jgi:hypothetical protein
LPGYALCGGGAHVHHTFGVGNFLYSLEPTLTQSDEPTPQTFTARSKDHINPDPSIIDTYAMGIKLYSSIQCQQYIQVERNLPTSHIIIFICSNY